jgi:hypothetical protein
MLSYLLEARNFRLASWRETPSVMDLFRKVCRYCTYIRIYMHTCMHACMHACMRVWSFLELCRHTCMQCMHTYMQCMHTCIHNNKAMTTTTQVRVMARPSPTRELLVRETETGFDILWQTPADQGFGLDDESVVTQYTVTLSLCNFLATSYPDCLPRILEVPAEDVCTKRTCTYSTPQSVTLLRGKVYSISVIAMNMVGPGDQTQAQVVRAPWKVTPTLIHPELKGFPLRVTRFGSDSFVWSGTMASQHVILQVCVHVCMCACVCLCVCMHVCM